MNPRPLRALARRRALALIRVSQEREGMTSPDVQRHAIQTYADANAIDIHGWIEGVDESGSRRKSAWWPKLSGAIDQIESGEADLILVWKYSRTARNRLRWAVAIDRMDSLGGGIISVTEPVESATASGRFARGMLGEMNAYQADLISESWKETQARRIREGKPATGRARFGYIRNRAADTFEPHPEQAPIVAELYDRYLAGHGMSSLTRWLNQIGQRTSGGGQWQTPNVKVFMDRGFAAGLLYVHGELLQGSHPPIIDRDTWEAFLAKRAKSAGAPRGSLRMASGLLRCPCGGPMMATRTTGNDGHYACARRTRGDASCTFRASIARHLMEQYITEWIADLPAKVEELREAEARAAATRLSTIEDRTALAKLIIRGERRLADLVVRLVDGSISQAAYDAAASKLEADLADLRARHLAAAPAPNKAQYDHVPALAAGFPQLSPPAQNRVTRSLISEIRIAPATRPGAGVWRERITIVPIWDSDE